MKVYRPTIAFVLSAAILINFVPEARACGPESIEPIFVFTDSPDLPFADYARGKIGILKPTHGRKTLFIAYRYLNGGAFTVDEQQALVEALNGKAPENDDGKAVKAWIAARSDIGIKEETLPEIYTERQYGGYDFFPNCAQNAFEVATETLKERAARYGAEDQNVRSWLAAQDTVFQNCAGGAGAPAELGPDSPTWLRKDREYQIAAAHFYSLNFDEARKRFEKIALDGESDWQQTADYLVARTLVRQASLSDDKSKQHAVYEQAEHHLQKLLSRGDKFHDGAQKLLALVKYRVHPEQRVQELARILSAQNANGNLRQDLIDYVWLLDKLESQILIEEAKRKKALEPGEPKEEPSPFVPSKESIETSRAIQKGELIQITLYPRSVNGELGYGELTTLTFKYDTSEKDVLAAFEERFGRKLTAEEGKLGKAQYASALYVRKLMISPNSKWRNADSSRYEGCNYECDKLSRDLLPDYLRADDLSDWIFTQQTQDESAYGHALEKWRETDSAAWLATVLTKADRASPGLDRLLSQAERIQRDSPAFPTIAYHLVRLKMAFGKAVEARKLLDEIISWPSELLPVSAQNQFVEQRFRLATNLSEFLKFAGRKPVAFYEYGRIGKISDLLEWNADTFEESREDYDKQIEEKYKELLPWDNRVAFDEQTVDFFNWHFSLEALVSAAHDPALPDYLQRRLILAAWTRAILLKNHAIAERIAPDVIKVAPEMSPVFNLYLNARTSQEKEDSALYVLLKFPDLSPLVVAGVPAFGTAEASDYDFGMSWWCTPSSTEYDINEGKEVPKIVAKPGFLTPEQLQAAQRERAALIALGNGKSYLGKQVLRWAAARPQDPRVPEALFIAVKANESYKYGCDGWQSDEETMQKAESLLRTLYPRSLWTAKLDSAANN